MINLPQPIEFEWDEGNQKKNWSKHKVQKEEAEEVFFSSHKKIYKDIVHSVGEPRLVVIGQTLAGRKLYIAFTIRHNTIRVISARDLNKKEYYLLKG